MSSNNFIVTSEGFIKDISFNVELMERKITYTLKLREALRVSSSRGSTVLTKYELKGFLFNPWKEEPIKGLYEVVQRKNKYDCYEEIEHLSMEYFPRRVTMTSETDVKFLNGGELQVDKLLTFEEAKRKALDLNREMIADLMKKQLIIDELKR